MNVQIYLQELIYKHETTSSNRYCIKHRTVKHFFVRQHSLLLIVMATAHTLWGKKHSKVPLIKKPNFQRHFSNAQSNLQNNRQRSNQPKDHKLRSIIKGSTILKLFHINIKMICKIGSFRLKT